ncbi:unnamed protein product [Schistosoma mattheei]|uniref:Uncharacterized protein n=1 Tax=Schistosoma mattheei TaxID=31246 RepID=A0A183PQY8_9TREM|nr:unnamed protein product [Schistosoma mattheei]
MGLPLNLLNTPILDNHKVSIDCTKVIDRHNHPLQQLHKHKPKILFLNHL